MFDFGSSNMFINKTKSAAKLISMMLKKVKSSFEKNTKEKEEKSKTIF